MNTIQHLQENGWVEYPDRLRPSARCFYKRYATPTRCNCNNDKDGKQVCVSVSQWQDHQSFEIEICGEASDESWIKMQNYGYRVEITEALETIPRLLAMWETFANYKPTEQ